MSNVYILRCGDVVKIGISNDPYKRVKQLQTGNSNKISLVCYVKMRTRIEAHNLESVLHKEFYSDNTLGEWFDINELDVIDYIRNEHIINVVIPKNVLVTESTVSPMGFTMFGIGKSVDCNDTKEYEIEPRCLAS